MKRITILKKTIGLLSFMLSTSIVFAAETTTSISAANTPDNTIKYSLIGLIIVLLLIIGAMGNVVISLSKV